MFCIYNTVSDLNFLCQEDLVVPHGIQTRPTFPVRLWAALPSEGALTKVKFKNYPLVAGDLMMLWKLFILNLIITYMLNTQHIFKVLALVSDKRQGTIRSASLAQRDKEKKNIFIAALFRTIWNPY